MGGRSLWGKKKGVQEDPEGRQEDQESALYPHVLMTYFSLLEKAFECATSLSQSVDVIDLSKT